MSHTLLFVRGHTRAHRAVTYHSKYLIDFQRSFIIVVVDISTGFLLVSSANNQWANNIVCGVHVSPAKIPHRRRNIDHNAHIIPRGLL